MSAKPRGKHFGNKFAVRHGLSKHPLYSVWSTMKQRCSNPNHKKYYLYGERGISVCERWLNSFPNFLEDMGDRPENMTLDRVDTDGPYCRDNCKWASYSDQNRGRRKYKRTRNTNV